MKAFDFYKLTENKLRQLAELYEINNLEKYYKQTDYHENMPISHYKGLSQVFAQLAFHAQNGAKIVNTVNFIDNKESLDEITNNFNPDKFLKKYNLQKIQKSEKNNKNTEQNKIIDNAAEKLSEELRNNLKRDQEKMSLLLRYAKTLLYSAIYVHSFSDKEEIVNDLNEHYPNKDIKALIKYFTTIIPDGFGTALSCDFLKEFNEEFDLPKPDRHIKGTLTALGVPWKNDYDCINKMIELTNEINHSLKKKITVYQLDRMIYLVCSQNFFLDSNNSIKLLYWNQCAGKTK